MEDIHSQVDKFSLILHTIHLQIDQFLLSKNSERECFIWDLGGINFKSQFLE
ncbi:hypothetical protein LguiA_020709 [Lonicera macranthoides]